MKAVNFEVFGKVQGVFFRKHTDTTAKKLGLVGHVRNTDSGTVVGTIEGPDDKIETITTASGGILTDNILSEKLAPNKRKSKEQN